MDINIRFRLTSGGSSSSHIGLDIGQAIHDWLHQSQDLNENQNVSVLVTDEPNFAAAAQRLPLRPDITVFVNSPAAADQPCINAVFTTTVNVGRVLADALIQFERSKLVAKAA